MAEAPDRLRHDIEETRTSLTRDVDRLAEKTSPKRVAQRRWNSVKEKVMGTSEHAAQHAASAADTMQGKASQLGDAASEKAHDVAGTVKHAPRAVAQQTQGNPLAAGIIAFGVGMLAATLIPVTDAERRAGQQLKDHSDDLTDRVKDVAAEMKDDLSGSVQHAVEQVKETTTDAARTTRDQAQTSAQDAKDHTRQAAQNAS
ncbi:DUF3618 domain-containing protein [Actinoplanes sp. NPDC049118]|uniref:DUF3618 domain-containing protein n=1 Tax=Actinoplanes sp. NPDC049118 TaxID=3155769 RepID=UPI0033C5CE62